MVLLHLLRSCQAHSHMCVLQILSLDAARPMVWPEGTTAPRLAPGSVNVFDCHDQFLDFRAWPVEDPTEPANLVVLRCYLLSSDITHLITRLVWMFDSSVVLPCNVRLPPCMGFRLKQVQTADIMGNLSYVIHTC